MDWFGDITQLLLGGGMLGSLLFYNSRSRKERAAARSAELTNTDSVLKQKESYIADLRQEQIDLKAEKEELREEAREARKNEALERDKVTNLYKQLSDKNVEEIQLREQIVMLKYYRCEVPECKKRTPPRFEAINENIQGNG